MKRFLTIALILILTVSLTGVSTTKVYCTYLDKEITKSCCEDQQGENDCCKQEVEYKRLTTDISTVNASVEMQDVLLFAVAYLSTLENPIAVLEKQDNFGAYSPPLLTFDIPVLIKVFRI